ncbi:hypothetical protein BC831DRAFT_441242 [Entophlyctis helioformis]|nr:hypothetical protein BC831DRAFT_441242 [Entophlyctis helioformis]
MQQTQAQPQTAPVVCRWSTCTASFQSGDQLLPHISTLHLTANHMGRSVLIQQPPQQPQQPLQQQQQQQPAAPSPNLATTSAVMAQAAEGLEQAAVAAAAVAAAAATATTAPAAALAPAPPRQHPHLQAASSPAMAVTTIPTIANLLAGDADVDPQHHQQSASQQHSWDPHNHDAAAGHHHYYYDHHDTTPTLTATVPSYGYASPYDRLPQQPQPHHHQQQQQPAAPQQQQNHNGAAGNGMLLLCKWNPCSTNAFQNVDDLIRHVSADHLPRTATNHLRPHGCLWFQCDQRFESFEDLTGHVSTDHIGNGKHSYVCEWGDCDRKGRPFTQRPKIMRHIQTREKPYACPEETCQKQFTLPSALTVHLRKHTGERPYECKADGCDKRFADSSNLTKHLRVHTGVRPFKCPIEPCDKKFARPDQVARHTRVHRTPSAAPVTPVQRYVSATALVELSSGTHGPAEHRTDQDADTYQHGQLPPQFQSLQQQQHLQQQN